VSFDEPLLDELAGGEVALVHSDDRVMGDEDRDLVVVHDARARCLEGIEDDEVVRLVLIDLGALVTMLRILDGERMKLELFGNELELLAERVRDVEPAWVLAAELRELVGGPIDDGVRLFNEEARGHVSQYARRSGGEATNDADELLRVEGLREVGLGVAAIGLTAGIGDAGEDHEGYAPECHAQLAGKRGSIHARHLHVEHDDGGWILLDHAESLGAVTRLDHAEAALGEKLALDGERLDIVVDDEHRTWPRSHTERHASLCAYGVP